MDNKQKQTPSFDATDADATLIQGIAARAVLLCERLGLSVRPMDVAREVTACHLNGTPLDLAGLLGARDDNFFHDVFGIRRYIDRDNGRLPDTFVPRYALSTRNDSDNAAALARLLNEVQSAGRALLAHPSAVARLRAALSKMPPDTASVIEQMLEADLAALQPAAPRSGQ